MPYGSSRIAGSGLSRPHRFDSRRLHALTTSRSWGLFVSGMEAEGGEHAGIREAKTVSEV